jgi:hypothetical protein
VGGEEFLFVEEVEEREGSQTVLAPDDIATRGRVHSRPKTPNAFALGALEDLLVLAEQGKRRRFLEGGRRDRARGGWEPLLLLLGNGSPGGGGGERKRKR